MEWMRDTLMYKSLDFGRGCIEIIIEEKDEIIDVNKRK